MKIEFEIILTGASRLTEIDLANDFLSCREKLAELEDPEGIVRIVGDAGRVESSFGDDLDVLVDRLCIKAVSELAQGKPFQLEYFAYPGHVDLVPEGSMIRIQQSESPSSAIQRSELLPALLDCAERYLDWMDKLPDAHSYEERRSRQRHAIQSARALLASSTV